MARLEEIGGTAERAILHLQDAGEGQAAEVMRELLVLAGNRTRLIARLAAALRELADDVNPEDGVVYPPRMARVAQVRALLSGYDGDGGRK